MWKKIKQYWFRKKVLGMLKDMPTASKEEMISQENAVMICMLQEHWKPEMNDFWELEGNKTVIREGLVCSECKKPVVMSNGLFEAYSNNPNNPVAVCIGCSLGLVKRENEIIIHKKLKE
jgi:hypothetical protein